MIAAVLLAASIAALAPSPAQPIKPPPPPRQITWPLMPPAKYDHPYRGPVNITTVATKAAANAACATVTGQTTNVGCAQVRNGTCYIIVAAQSVLDTWRGSMALLLRHETAHCNGWLPHHPSN